MHIKALACENRQYLVTVVQIRMALSGNNKFSSSYIFLKSICSIKNKFTRSIWKQVKLILIYFILIQYIQSITLISIINQYKIISEIFYLLVLSL